MSSPKTTRNADMEADVAFVENGIPVTEDEIRRRAFEIYLERGQHPGCDLDDWLQAERELQRGDFWDE